MIRPDTPGIRLAGLLLLVLLCGLALLYALASGSIAIPANTVLQILTGGAADVDSNQASVIVLQLRLPRALAALVTGALLAMAGAYMQVLLRNPLADPYVLGVSGGAAVGALVALMLGLGSAVISGSALGGALASMLLVFGLSHRNNKTYSEHLLLTGIVVATGWGALISFLLATSPDQQLRGMLFWLMGDMSHTGTPTLESLVLLACLIISLPLAPRLNLYAHGPMRAAALGVAIQPLQWTIFVLASVMTATAVQLAGAIGFIGLVVPHIMRQLMGSDHRYLLPASALGGATLLLLADTLARTILSPMLLPTGVLTAMLGVPLFLYLLNRKHG